MRSPLIAAALALCAVTAPAQSPPPSPASDAILQERALTKRGATKEARQALESLIPTLRTSRDAANLSRALNDLSMLQSGDGDYAAATKAATEAVDVSHAAADLDGEARALDNLGVAQLYLADYPAASASFSREITLVRQLKDPQAEVQAGNNLGSALFYQGSYTQAFAAYQAASTLLDAATSQPWFADWRQITDVNIATLYQRLGRFDKALQIYRGVQASHQTMTATDRAQLASNLGALYRHLGDPYKALDSYQSALHLLQQQHNADESLGVLLNIGTLYVLDRGDLARASATFHQVLALAGRSHNRNAAIKAHLYLGETALRQHDAPNATREFQAAASAASDLGIPEDQWQAEFGLGRAALASQDLTEAERQFRAAITTLESIRGQIHLIALKAEFLAEKRDVYDALIRLLLARNDVPAVFEFLERSRARNFQDRLQSARSGPLSLAEAQRQLPPETLLLEFWTAGDDTALLWATRNQAGVAQRRLSAGEQSALSTLARGLPANLAEDWRASVAPLAALLPPTLPPFQRAELRHLLLVPDGSLASLPLELAPLTPQQSLLERYDVTCLPSAALLLRPPASPSWHFPWQQQLAAFGAPAIAAANPTEIVTTPGLPGSEAEIHAIAAMVPGAARTYLGPRDNREFFLGGAANAAPLLHISTHGFADAANPEGTRLLFSSAEGRAADYVFLRELEPLDLSRVDLATLSACDTERGKLVRGEGTQAFSRALLAAGARTSITTLWKIGDAPAAEFMKQFYFFLVVKGQPKAEALRSAKLKLLRSGTSLASPRHWAAFVISGDGQAPVPVFLSWAKLLLAAAAVAALLLALARLLLLRRQ